MGNCISRTSKKALREQLEVVEQKYTVSDASLTARVQEVARLKIELEDSKACGSDAANETSRMQKRAEELDQERQEQIAELQAELKDVEHAELERRQAMESTTQERDDTRKVVERLEEKMRTVEEERDHVESESRRRQTEMDSVVDEKQAELKNASSKLDQLADKVQTLQQNNQTLAERLATAKTDSAKELSNQKRIAEVRLSSEKYKANRALTAAKQEAAKELSDIKASTQGHLSEARTELESSCQELAATRYTLASTQQALAASSAEVESLRRAATTTTTTVAPYGTAMVPRLASANTANAYSEHVRFSHSKDIRVSVGRYDGEVRVDIREFYKPNYKTKKVRPRTDGCGVERTQLTRCWPGYKYSCRRRRRPVPVFTRRHSGCYCSAATVREVTASLDVIWSFCFVALYHFRSIVSSPFPSSHARF